MALQYASEGAQLLLVARRKSILESSANECRSLNSHSKCHIVTGDVALESTLAEVSAAARNLLGGCDILVLCAGLTSILPFEKLCSKDKDEPGFLDSVMRNVFNVNVFSNLLAVKHLLPLLKEDKGTILAISSAAGFMPAPTRAIYVASKHAVNGFFNSLRIEVQKYGVSVVLACPGTIDTDFRISALDHTDESVQQKLSKGIKPDKCARIVIRGADEKRREIHIPSYYKIAVILSFLFPSFIDRMAATKYNYQM